MFWCDLRISSRSALEEGDRRRCRLLPCGSIFSNYDLFLEHLHACRLACGELGKGKQGKREIEQRGEMWEKGKPGKHLERYGGPSTCRTMLGRAWNQIKTASKRSQGLRRWLTESSTRHRTKARAIQQPGRQHS